MNGLRVESAFDWKSSSVRLTLLTANENCCKGRPAGV